MASRRRTPESWLGRLANEVYLGALVVGAVVLLAGVVAALVAIGMAISNWVTLAD